MFYEYKIRNYTSKHVYGEVSIWQNAVFAEKELFSVSPFHTHIAKPTEHGSPISAR